MSYDPCDLFEYFETEHLHGLNYMDCLSYNNSTENSYIAGLCNMIPNSDKQFVFINLSRCGDDIDTILLINHELLHHSMYLHNYNLHKEEEIITWAEKESRVIYQFVLNELQTNDIT